MATQFAHKRCLVPGQIPYQVIEVGFLVSGANFIQRRPASFQAGVCVALPMHEAAQRKQIGERHSLIARHLPEDIGQLNGADVFQR